MLTANDVTRLLDVLEVHIDDWVPIEHNPIQVVTSKTGAGTIGYLTYLSDTALILAPIIPTEDLKEETELLAVDVLIPLSDIDLIFKLPITKSKEINEPKKTNDLKSTKDNSERR